MRRLIRRLIYGGSVRFKNHERKVLDCFLQRQPAPIQPLLETQLKNIELIQRFSKSKLVVVHFPPPGLEDALLLPNRSEELMAGRVRLAEPGGAKRISCDIVMHRGRLSSLEFKEPPPPKSASWECSEVSLLADLEAAEATGADEPSTAGKAWLAKIEELFPLSSVRPAATAEEEARLAERLGGLPSGLSELLQEANGFKLADWVFLGTRARRIVYPDCNYLLLAESSQEAICVKEGEPELGLFHLDQISEEARVIEGPFPEALMKLIGSKGSGDVR